MGCSDVDFIKCFAEVAADCAADLMQTGFGSPATFDHGDGEAAIDICGVITERYTNSGAIATGQEDTHRIVFETYKTDTFPPDDALDRGRFRPEPRLAVTDESTIYIVTDIDMSPEDITTAAVFRMTAERFGLMNEVANSG